MSTRQVGAQPLGLQTARSLAEIGWECFPLTPGAKTPVRGTHGHLDATTDYGRLLHLWHVAGAHTGLDDFGVGVRCRGAAGFVVDLDVKGDADGVRNFYALCDDNDSEGWWDDTHYAENDELTWPASWVRYRTRSGGMHILFASPPQDVHTGANVLGPGIDLRGPRGFRAVFDPAEPYAYRLVSGAYTNPVGGLSLPQAPEWLLAVEALYGPVRAQNHEVASLPQGEMCEAVWAATAPEKWDFGDHHSTASRVLHLVRLGEEGHTGVMDALVQLRPLYIEGRNAKTLIDGQPRDPELDFDRMVEGALSKGSGASSSSDPCTRVNSLRKRFGL